MARKNTPASRDRVTVVSFTRPRTVRRIFQLIGHTTGVQRDLGEYMFARIARTRKLQLQVLAVLSKHTAEQRSILGELAKDNQFRKKLLKAAGRFL
jgi:hypothetical protein